MKDVIVVNSVNLGMFAFITLSETHIVLGIAATGAMLIYNAINAINAYRVYRKNKKDDAK